MYKFVCSILSALFVLSSVSIISAQTAPAQPLQFRKIQLLNSDFTIPSDNGIVGWHIQNNSYPGKLEIQPGTAGSPASLQVTPYPTKLKNSKEIRVLILSSTAFKARIGDTIKVSFDYYSPKGGKIGCILYNGKANQWVIWQRTGSSSWNTYTRQYKITVAPRKAAVDKEIRQYKLGFDVFNSPVAIRNIKLEVEKGAGRP